jgi:DNA polymerase (family X)
MTSLITAKKIVSEICEEILINNKKLINKPTIVGSIRRNSPQIKDIDFIILTHSIETNSSFSLGKKCDFEVVEIKRIGKRIVSAIISNKYVNFKISVDLFFVLVKELPFAMIHYTGNKNFNIKMRLYAKKKGWLLNQYGIFERDEETDARNSENIRTEKDIFTFIEMDYVVAKDRNL